jgi:hypothetical protein
MVSFMITQRLTLLLSGVAMLTTLCFATASEKDKVVCDNGACPTEPESFSVLQTKLQTMEIAQELAQTDKASPYYIQMWEDGGVKGQCKAGDQISTEDGCVEAAQALGLSLANENVHVYSNSAWGPPGCWAMQGTHLHLNQASRNPDDCTDFARCLCKEALAQPVQHTMQIFVHRSQARAKSDITLDVKASDTIFTVKVKIFRKTGIPSDEQTLFYNMKQLEDGHTLSEYNIQKDSTLLMAHRPGGGLL